MAAATQDGVCVVAGVGPGNGTALSRRFAADADRPDDFFCQPDDIAETVHHVAHQPPSVWTFEVDLRPAGESW